MKLTACDRVELIGNVALVLGIGNVELLLAEKAWDAIFLQLRVVEQRWDLMYPSCIGSSACLQPPSVCTPMRGRCGRRHSHSVLAIEWHRAVW